MLQSVKQINPIPALNGWRPQMTSLKNLFCFAKRMLYDVMLSVWLFMHANMQQRGQNGRLWRTWSDISGRSCGNARNTLAGKAWKELAFSQNKLQPKKQVMEEGRCEINPSILSFSHWHFWVVKCTWCQTSKRTDSNDWGSKHYQQQNVCHHTDQVTAIPWERKTTGFCWLFAHWMDSNTTDFAHEPSLDHSWSSFFSHLLK